jgi:hypothetical protein
MVMAPSMRSQALDDLQDEAQEELSSAVEKYEMDCLKLIEAVERLDARGEKHTLRKIADLTGLSKDEVNRYLTEQVNELYNLKRLKHVRSRNRPLYDHLITSGPPRVEDGEWVGIEANTSKFRIFEAVAMKYGYDVDSGRAQGRIVELEYQGIEELSYERQGLMFSFQEPVLYLDQYRPSAEEAAAESG